jgi:hypothetical protein
MSKSIDMNMTKNIRFNITRSLFTILSILITMSSDQIQSVFEAEGITTEIACAKAFELAEKHGFSKKEIARYCNEKKIKIRACQLGCFS